MTGKMHVDEVNTDVLLVRRLLASQFPQWADLPLIPVSSAGTDNAIYRLGSNMVVRLPRIHWAVGQVEKEHSLLPFLAPLLPLTIPVPIAKGTPGEGYPWEWSIYEWLEGESATIERIANPCQAAIDLAQFIAALQRINTTGGLLAVDHNLRGVPALAMRDTNTRSAIAALDGMIDTDTALQVWQEALMAPEWSQAPVCIHGDLLPGNLLVHSNCLSAVIDFGGLGVGDPACDLKIAWGLFKDESREVFRKALAVDDATWTRGRGYVLSQAVIFIPYYLKTNPVGVSNARHMLNEVLADYRANN